MKSIFSKTHLTAFTASSFLLLSLASVSYSQYIYGDGSDTSNISPLMSAVSDGDISGVEFFSKAGRSILDRKNIGGATALHIASRSNRLKIAEILIDSGADVNIVDNDGWTPLMRAVSNGDENMISILLNGGADASKRNIIGETAIIHAANAGCSACMESILSSMDYDNISDKILQLQFEEAFLISERKGDEATRSVLSNYKEMIDEKNYPSSRNYGDDSEIGIEEMGDLITSPDDEFEDQPTIVSDSNLNYVLSKVKDDKLTDNSNYIEEDLEVDASDNYIFPDLVPIKKYFLARGPYGIVKKRIESVSNEELDRISIDSKDEEKIFLFKKGKRSRGFIDDDGYEYEVGYEPMDSIEVVMPRNDFSSKKNRKLVFVENPNNTDIGSSIEEIKEENIKSSKSGDRKFLFNKKPKIVQNKENDNKKSFFFFRGENRNYKAQDDIHVIDRSPGRFRFNKGKSSGVFSNKAFSNGNYSQRDLLGRKFRFWKKKAKFSKSDEFLPDRSPQSFSFKRSVKKEDEVNKTKGSGLFNFFKKKGKSNEYIAPNIMEDKTLGDNYKEELEDSEYYIDEDDFDYYKE